MKLKILFLLFLIVGLAWSCSESSVDPIDEPDPIDTIKYETWTGLQIVMFTPLDVELPDDYKERMKEVTDYAEWFMSKWMGHWGYPCDNPLKIRKDSLGYPILWRVKGKLPQSSGAYDELGYDNTEVIPKAIEQYGMPSDNQTWWIISYPGPPKKAFRGGGNFKGGTSSANFTPDTGTLIQPGDDDLAGGAAATFKLKAMIHELTHALGLGHIAPRDYDQLGNALMGPTNNAYHKYFPAEDRVYLSEPAAAMLWKHPLFAGNFDQVKQVPSVLMTDFQTSYDGVKDVLTVTGQLNSTSIAHSVVIRNESENAISDYWTKSYTSSIAEDGTFSCEIPEPDKALGKLIIAFCFNNGAISGKTGKIGLNNGIEKSYVFENNDFKFN